MLKEVSDFFWVVSCEHSKHHLFSEIKKKTATVTLKGECMHKAFIGLAVKKTDYVASVEIAMQK